MKDRRWAALAPIAMLVVWGGGVGLWTYGFRAFTSFSAALAAAGPLPRTTPSLEVVDQHDRSWDVGAPHEGFVLLQAMYLRCPDGCPIAMGRLHETAHHLEDRIPGDLRIVSLSVDHDPPSELRSMWEMHGAMEGWTMASLTAQPVQDPLAKLGVWMSRRSDGGINHGLDLFLIDPAGRVIRTFDPDQEPIAIAAAVRAAMR